MHINPTPASLGTVGGKWEKKCAWKGGKFATKKREKYVEIICIYATTCKNLLRIAVAFEFYCLLLGASSLFPVVKNKISIIYII